MEKIIKKYGSSHVVRLDPEDMIINNLEEGDIIDFTITKIRKKKK